MCGRFSLAADPEELQLAFPGFDIPTQYAARYNIAPTQPIMALVGSAENKFDYFIWGLVPSWAKAPNIGARMINARSEGITEKPSYRGPFKYKRCLVPASGFYEWKTSDNGKRKTPFYFHAMDNKPFAIAGLWDEWLGSDGSELRSLTLITTEPNETTKPYHDRMPVIIASDDYDAWLHTAPEKSAALVDLLKPLTKFALEVHEVSALVNSPSNDRAECIQPYRSTLF